MENSTLNALSMLGVSPSAMKVIQTANAPKLKMADIPAVLKEASIGDTSALHMEFTPSPDVFSLMLMDSKIAADNHRQAITYFNLCGDFFIPTWLPPEAVGGVPRHIKEDFQLATDPTKKDAMTFMNGFNKAFNKTRFF